MNYKVYYGNNAKLFTPTATSSLTGFPVSNVITLDPQRIWKTTKAANVYITFGNISSSVTYTTEGVFLINSNLNCTVIGGDSFELQLSSDNFSNVTSTNFLTKIITKRKKNDAGTLTAYTYVINYAIPSGTKTFKQFRIKINLNSSLAQSVYHVGETINCSNVFSPSFGYAASGIEAGNLSRRVEVENQFGTKFLVNQVQSFEGEFLNFGTLSEANELENICMENRVVFYPSLGASDPIYYGGMTQASPRLNRNELLGNQIDKELNFKFSEVI
jgi:hypothetical protein